MASVKEQHTGRLWSMTLSFATDSGFVFFFISYPIKFSLALVKKIVKWLGQCFLLVS